MSNSNLVNVRVPAHLSNYSQGRSGRKIEIITIHHMAGILSAKNCGSIFQRVGKGASAHYGVGKNGEIGQYVDEANTAWANTNWDSNCKAVTIETSNCKIGENWAVSDTVLNSLIRLVADIAKRNGLGILVKGQNLTWHSMYANTNCPGPYLLSKLDYIVAEANKINNTVFGTTNSNVDIEQLAREVIAGKYGSGDARKQALGSNYNAVQARVNEILLGNKVTSNKKSVDEIAREVINGAWGNGEDRKNRLKNAGYDPVTIQNIVNQKLLGTVPKSNLKSVDEIAREVMQGKWGNNPERKQKLIDAGYDYNAVQNRVNQLLR